MVAQCLIFRAVLLNDLPRMNAPEQLGPCSFCKQWVWNCRRTALVWCLPEKPPRTAPLFYLLLEKRSAYVKGKLSISHSDCREERKWGQRYRFWLHIKFSIKKISRRELYPHVNNFFLPPDLRFRNLISGLWFSMVNMALYLPCLLLWQDRHPKAESRSQWHRDEIPPFTMPNIRKEILCL